MQSVTREMSHSPKLNLIVHDRFSVQRVQTRLTILSTHERDEATETPAGLLLCRAWPHDLDGSERTKLTKHTVVVVGGVVYVSDGSVCDGER